jgi:ABC-type Fe3+-hydroxamate transport system substrate-binding protein
MDNVQKDNICTQCLHYEDQSVNTVYFANHTKHINTLSGKSAEFLDINLLSQLLRSSS